MESYKKLDNNKDIKHISVDKIKKYVRSLLNDLNNNIDKGLIREKNFAELRGKYCTKYSDLMITYPALFNMIIEKGENFDMNQFNKMMISIAKVRNNIVSNEDASKKFGEEMANKYVNPLINETDNKNNDEKK